MDVTVIVPARDAAATIAECVEALVRQEYHAGTVQVIVVDDGSRDETAERARLPGVEVLRVPAGGPGAARNRGAERARGEVFVFTDADCVPSAGWLARMVEPFRSPDVSATRGAYATTQRSLTARFVQLEYESRYRIALARESIDFIDTYAAAFRRDLFFDCGGFDERLPVAQDQEFSFRYSRRGGRMVFVPDAVVLHRHASTPWTYLRKKVRIGYWKTRVLARHPDKAVRDSHTPQSLKVEVAAAALAMAALPFCFWPFGRAVLLGAFAAGAACGLPHTLRCLRRDPAVGCAAGAFLALRAVGLALGLAAGLLRPPPADRGAAPRSWLRSPAAETVPPAADTVPPAAPGEHREETVHELA